MKPSYRYSRREVTKRTFVLGSQQPSISVISTKVSPLATFAVPRSYRESPPSRASSRDLAESTCSSPLAAIIEHPHVQVTPSPRNERAVQDETQFLSSTPKPGKASSTRRRPVFYQDKPYSRPSSLKSATLNLSRIPKVPTHRVSSAGKRTREQDRPNSVNKATSSIIREQVTVSNTVNKTSSYRDEGSVLKSTNKATPIRDKVIVSKSVNKTTSNNTDAVSVSKSVNRDVSNNRGKVSVSKSVNKAVSNKRDAVSVSKSVNNSTSNNRETVIVSKSGKAVSNNKDKVSVSKSVNKATSNNRGAASGPGLGYDDDSIVVQSQPSRPVNGAVQRGRLSAFTGTGGSVNNQRQSGALQSGGPVNKRRASEVLQRGRGVPPSVQEEEEEETDEEEDENVIQGDVKMILWEMQGMKRRKSDFCEADVLLNTYMEVLESQLDECDSRAERRAVQILEKYLVKDITAMIDSNHTVKTLQTDVRKTAQILQQKQRKLMELQQKRLKAEENAPKDDEVTELVKNRKTIDIFLSDLKQLIAKC